MGRSVVWILICAVLYILIRMFTSGITIESDVYGYYKDGRLNQRGIISLVQQIKRLIPIKTEDTTVVGVTYNYEDGNPPKGQINYYHRIDDEKVEFYLSHRQYVVNHMASVQCANSEVVDMLGKLEKITISFYQKDQFLFGMELSQALCASGEGAGESGEPENSIDPDVPADNSSVTENTEGADHGNNDVKNVNASSDPVVQKHISMLSKNLPIKTSFGRLAAVEAEDEHSVRYIFDVDDGSVAAMEGKRGQIVRSYCTNAHLKNVIDSTDHISLVLRNGEKSFITWVVTGNDCR